MSFEIVITKAAHVEAENAYHYYQTQKQGLGERFLEALLKRYADLSIHPHHYSYIDEDSKKVFRDVKLQTFPFVIIFEIVDQKVIIYAVHNLSRHPDKKLPKR